MKVSGVVKLGVAAVALLLIPRRSSRQAEHTHGNSYPNAKTQRTIKLQSVEPADREINRTD